MIMIHGYNVQICCPIIDESFNFTWFQNLTLNQELICLMNSVSEIIGEIIGESSHFFLISSKNPSFLRINM
jgi:hypothetical protein